MIGAAVQNQCSCAPGLQGFVIGAPIGAIVGGIGATKLVTPKQEVVFRR
jgi:hypothetical protein